MTSHGRPSLNACASQKAARRHTKTREFLVAAAASFLIALALTQSATAGAVPLPRGAGAGGTFLHATPARPTGPSVEGQSAGSLSPLVTGGNGESLKYWGGEVQHKPELDLLFWGDNFWNGTQPYYEGVSLYTEYKGFYDDLSNELEAPGEASWQGILSQYFGKSGTYGDAHVVGETDETAINAPQNITVENIKKEITTWANRGLAQNPNTQVIVLAAPGTSYAEDPEKGCGYHGIDEQGYSYAFVAYAGDLDHYFNKNKENYSCNYRASGKEVETTQLMWSSTAIASHEFAEEATDPGLNSEYGWYSNEGQEIGDLCDYEPLNSVELPEKNGRPGWWYVTELWDDGGGNTCKLEDPPYSEPPPPTATTEAATSIAYRQATLNGSLNPNGPEAHYDFEYGLTTSYGSKIPTSEGSAGFGTTTVGESATVTGLKPGTKYHYRIVAKTYTGTTAGVDKEFTTPIPPPVVKTEGATSVGDVHAIVQGTVNPEEFSTTYQFEYWPLNKASEVSKVPASGESVGSGGSNVKVSQTLTGLSHYTEYIYRLVATNAGGTSRGSEASFTTGPFMEGRTSPDPSGGTENVLQGMSCSSATACVAVGSYKNSSGVQVTLAERWNGSEWQLMSTPNPTGASLSFLRGVSCASSTLCIAVGQYKNSSGVLVTLAERWNGTEWVIQTTPNPSGASSAELYGVSCPSTTACMAVGIYGSGANNYTLTESWNGTEWTIKTSPNTVAAYNALYAVSCYSANVCTAVGTAFEPLIERWNGTEWTIQKGVSKSTRNVLSAISCPTEKSCIAVGEYAEGFYGGPWFSLGESWNGTEWSLQPTINPYGAKGSRLIGLACTSSTACVAAGSYENGAGTTSALSEGLVGTEWKVHPTPLPSGATSGELTTVWCSSSSACITGGHYLNSSGVELTLSESFGAPTAKTESATNVTATKAKLNGLVGPNGEETTYDFEYGTTTAYGTTAPIPAKSLESETAATAVSQEISGLSANTTYHYRISATNGAGTIKGEDHTFTTTLLWTISATPDPSGGTENVLQGMSCSSVTACVAVGSYKNSLGVQVTLAERWNGSEWQLMSTPNPTGASLSFLRGVSCASSTLCIAVGQYKNSSGVLVTLAERWNGTEWVVQTTPNPSGAAELYGVSCSSTTACMAVGTYEGGIDPLTERWNGTEWTIKTAPKTGSFINELYAVSCYSANVCTAVGTAFEPLIERWNGTEWTIQKGVSKSTRNVLSAISCPTEKSCIAVGEYAEGDFGGPWFSLGESWNGTEWSSQSVPNPSGAKGSWLPGLACTSATVCMAVGGYENSSGVTNTLIEGLHGTEWRLETSPNPTGGTSDELTGVWCSSSAACAATGHYVNSSGTELTLGVSSEWP